MPHYVQKDLLRSDFFPDQPHPPLPAKSRARKITSYLYHSHLSSAPITKQQTLTNAQNTNQSRISISSPIGARKLSKTYKNTKFPGPSITFSSTPLRCRSRIAYFFSSCTRDVEVEELAAKTPPFANGSSRR